LLHALDFQDVEQGRSERQILAQAFYF